MSGWVSGVLGTLKMQLTPSASISANTSPISPSIHPCQPRPLHTLSSHSSELVVTAGGVVEGVRPSGDSNRVLLGGVEAGVRRSGEVVVTAVVGAALGRVVVVVLIR